MNIYDINKGRTKYGHEQINKQGMKETPIWIEKCDKQELDGNDIIYLLV